MADGINRLIAVTQQKASNANEEAVSAAEKQKSHLEKKQSLRGVQSAFENATKDSGVTQTETKTRASAMGAEATVAKPADYLGRYAKSGFDASSKFSTSDLMKNLGDVGNSPTRFASGITAFMEGFKTTLDKSIKTLEPQDRLGNYEIQDLMSAYNQAESLASSTKKKLDDQIASIIGKV